MKDDLEVSFSEREIMLGLENGDKLMWDCVYYPLWDRAVSVASRWLNPFRFAKFEDIQDIAIRAIGEAAKKVQAGEVGSFDYLKVLTAIIAKRRALNFIEYWKAQRRDARQTETIEGLVDLHSPSPGPFEQANKLDVAKLLVNLAKKLPEHQQRLLFAFYLDGLKDMEIAKKFGMKMGTVSATLSRARYSLRAELENFPALKKELLHYWKHCHEGT